jgi:hypothetical protein
MALLVGGSTTASAADDLDPRIVYALAAEPGGVVTSPTTVVWPELGMELTIQDDAVPFGLSTNCPSGNICAFSGTSEAGTRLTWGSCGTFSTAALSSVGSVANARSIGTVQARSGTTVLASTSAGNFVNVIGTVDNIRCF